MRYQEIAARLTGFSVPLFGVSWDPPEPDVTIARRVLAFLEDRRVLYNAYHLEVEEQCFHSVTEIRQFLTTEIGALDKGSKLGEHLRGIRAACRHFLDESGPANRRLHRGWGPFEAPFFTALGELRAAIGAHVGALAVMHGLDVEEQLASVLPAQDEA
jgi:hypothetical protein